jgi:hypothetical protein
MIAWLLCAHSLSKSRKIPYIFQILFCTFKQNMTVNPESLHAVRVRLDSASEIDYLMTIPVTASARDLGRAVEARFEKEQGYGLTVLSLSFSKSGTRLPEDTLVSVATRKLSPDRHYLVAELPPVQVRVEIEYGKAEPKKTYSGVMAMDYNTTLSRIINMASACVLPCDAHYKITKPLDAPKKWRDVPLLKLHFQKGAVSYDIPVKCASKYIPKKDRRIALDPKMITSKWIDVTDSKTGAKVGKQLQVKPA